MNDIYIDSLEILLDTLNRYPNSFIYRGQANAKWRLASSLERIVGNKWDTEIASKFEEFSLKEFKSKFHLYDRDNVVPESKLAWLAIMQHFGVPTRLIDFTESAYVALYFALEFYNPEVGGDLAVYAIDYTGIMDRSLEVISEKDSGFRETRHSVHSKQDSVFDSIVDRFAYNIAWVAEPGLVNTRLDRQAGSFLLSGNRGRRIEDILSQDLYANVDMHRIVIAGSMYDNVFALLRKMNINSKSLYGDLEGLARSIRMQMHVYSPQ